MCVERGGLRRHLVSMAGLAARCGQAIPWRSEEINPDLWAGETRKVITGIPGKTGVVYTLGRETGEFLWATATVEQNVIADIAGATGAVTENPEVIFRETEQIVFVCPNIMGGKGWEAGAYSPLTNTMYYPLTKLLRQHDGHGGCLQRIGQRGGESRGRGGAATCSSSPCRIDEKAAGAKGLLGLHALAMPTGEPIIAGISLREASHEAI